MQKMLCKPEWESTKLTNFVFVCLQRKAKGQDLFDKICEYINLAEKDYFGLNFIDKHGYTVWVENEKRVSKQVKSNSKQTFGHLWMKSLDDGTEF